MKLKLITGSTLGGAEYVADHLAQRLKSEDHHVDVINDPSLLDFREGQNLILITSTHGAGDFPDNLASCMAELEETQVDLSSLRFLVIAIGDSSYDTFCGAGIKAEVLLCALGATKIQSRLEIDVLSTSSPEDVADQWLDQQKLALFT